MRFIRLVFLILEMRHLRQSRNVFIVSDFGKCKRKLDGEEMAFFKLSDSTGGIEVCCFADAYKKRKNF